MTELFGSRVFNEKAMRERLSAEDYKNFRTMVKEGKSMDPQLAQRVARAMMDWAIAQGATHYTHWFQPMNNVTAGKHDAFLNPNMDGTVEMKFSAKALIKGEPDASSFPSGGLRNTFEARGYTTWDPTSPAFVKDGTLYIPTAFCSYTGEALDTKTPLLRSMQALSKQGVRLLRMLGNTTCTQVTPTVGAEQEYFLIDRELFEKRLDLKVCGRTLVGARPPKGQELDDHYFGHIRLRVSAFMHDLDRELWSLGVSSKTKHNEVAPAQHELAPLFDTANIACDHNQLMMETMRVVAKRHKLACLLHEKPFAGVNGSGKHNNYSLLTDDGLNLLDPGENPLENKTFLIVLCAFITAVNSYGDLLRLSATTPGNDYRLGGSEAPPSIVSVFLGNRLSTILQEAAAGSWQDNSCPVYLRTGVDVLTDLERDDSDRNRTSPFAFTGNKFEFRMVGSSQSIAMANVVLNTALAEVFSRFADYLETCEDRDAGIQKLISDTMAHHGRVIFNGNNYAESWAQEAARRGLPIIHNAVEAIDRWTLDKNMELFDRHRVFTRVECFSRQEVMLEHYDKVMDIEATTLIEMMRRQVLPALYRYMGELSKDSQTLSAVGRGSKALDRNLDQLTQLTDTLEAETSALEGMMDQVMTKESARDHALYICKKVQPQMLKVRQACDAAELLVDEKAWPMPTYFDLMFRV